MKHALLFLGILLLSTLGFYSTAQGDFDVRQHLSTVTRYGVVKDIADNSFVPSDIPEGCVPIHLNLVARHGTRSPTKKRTKELDRLEDSLKSLISGAKKQNLPLDRVPSWLLEWESPWKGGSNDGELMSIGEKELYDLGIRTRQKFPNLFDEEYHPDIYPINPTKILRTSASADAFRMGLFSGNGGRGPGKHAGFAVPPESDASDILLRFFDICSNYKNSRERKKPVVDKRKDPILDEITSALVGRYGLNFAREDISSLWFLCKQEASLWDKTNGACKLFNSSELTSLEWTDDLELYELKGCRDPLNYIMAVPLLEDVVESMKQAIQAREEKRTSGSYEKARLRFAHAETLLPFSCLLGLFHGGSEFDQIQKEQPGQLPPKLPHKRKWRGSAIVPFASNNMLILYSCPATEKSTSSYFVRVLHNEHPMPLPACGHSDFCPFEVFKEEVYGPHEKHTFDAICNEKVEHTGDQGKGDDNREDEL
ncbi:multiple inositol polyphosphate phosphatase 1-like [Neltuma alba]|uniref:multiple inositol polyphosphate phosphatase 1-like n=1 Tax=Neltuma alba TaxID=207710 RepID=UPI0010A3DEBE|nr:multiple inositol polyphosphate phosphatase 1-like [Prosopis alba]